MSTQMITNPPVLDTTGQAIVAALNNLTEATSPTNVYIDIPLSIPVSGWDDNTPHVYTWMNENIVGNCGIEVGFADGAEDVATTFIRVTKIVGGIKFSIDEVPSAPIPLIVRIINAKADSVIGDIDATMVETSAISGVTNVEEALTDLDGRVDDNADDIASNSQAISNLNTTAVKGQTTAQQNITTLSELNALSAGVHDRYLMGISGITNGWYGIIVATDNNVDRVPTQILYGTNGAYVRHSDDKVTWTTQELVTKANANTSSSLLQYLKQTTNSGATLTFTTSENRYTALVFVTSNDASTQSGVFAVMYKQNSIGSVTKLAGNNTVVSCDQTNGTLSVAVSSWSLVIVLTTGKMA